MNARIRNQLRALQAGGNLSSLAAYCEKQLREDNDELTRGCCLWNLSDAYAMMRDTNALYRNHCRFEAYVRTMPPMYRLWLVCDATQRLVLELGGYGDFWWAQYEKATENNEPLCESMLFEVHRAAFYRSPAMSYNKARAQWVSERFSTFLEAFQRSDSAPFYRLCYASLYRKQFDGGEDLIALCEPFLHDLRLPREESPFVAGEWERLNGKRFKQNQAQIGINHAVNALIDSGDVIKARELYETVRRYGMAANAYIEKRIKIVQNGY